MSENTDKMTAGTGFETQERVQQLRAKRNAYRKAHPEMMTEWSGTVLTDEEMDKLLKEGKN